MIPRHLGEIIWQRREQLGISQQMVCEGLCTAMTLSRFEKGRQTPSRDCVEAILQRLGLPDDRFYAQLTKRETRLVVLRKEVLACCGRFEQAPEEDRQQAHKKALEKLDELDRYVKKGDRINQQFILGVQATLGIVPNNKRLDILMEAIRLTSPRFDIDHLSNCMYSANEVAVINKIAVSYSRSGQRRKAIDIYRQLLVLFRERMPNHKYLPLIAHNYAQYLGLEKRFEESLEVSRLGRQTCIDQGHYYLLPRFLHIEAECHYSMGKVDRSAELYQAAYYIYGATGDKKRRDILKSEASDRLGLML